MAIEQVGFIVTEQNVDSGDNAKDASIDDIAGTFSMLLGNSPDSVSSFISMQRAVVKNSVLAVPQIIQIAKENGYQIVKLSVCLATDQELLQHNHWLVFLKKNYLKQISLA